MQGVRTLLLCLVGAVSAAQAAAEPVRVFAAASLATVLTELDEQWRKAGSNGLSISVAGSGVLARQILAGAPADLYLSADPRWVDVLVDEGLLRGDGRIDLLGNTLVLIAPRTDVQSEPFVLDSERVSAAFAVAVAQDPAARVAVGLLEAVPAGRYADEAMKALGVREQFDAHLVQTDNVRAALRLVSRREAALGIVYSTDAESTSEVQVLGTFPEGSHSPIVYALAALVESQATTDFIDWLQGDDAHVVFERHGFSVLTAPD